MDDFWEQLKKCMEEEEKVCDKILNSIVEYYNIPYELMTMPTSDLIKKYNKGQWYSIMQIKEFARYTLMREFNISLLMTASKLNTIRGGGYEEALVRDDEDIRNDFRKMRVVRDLVKWVKEHTDL